MSANIPVFPCSPYPNNNSTHIPIHSPQQQTAGILQQGSSIEMNQAKTVASSTKTQVMSSVPATATTVNLDILPTVVQDILAKGRLLKNFFQEKVAEGGFPNGWIEHVHRRNQTSQTNKIHEDHYWYTPKTGKRLRSTVEVRKFLEHLKATKGDEDLAWSMLKESAKKGTTKKRKATASEATDTKQGKKEKKQHISESKLKSSQSQQADSKKAKDSTLIAESKGISSPRRQKISAKKASSSNPFPQRPSLDPALPKVAESK